MGLSILFSSTVYAATAKIAVAANFTKTIEQIAEKFTEQTGYEVKFSFGPTGKLYAQIRNGAPFDAFFGADEFRPLKTIQDGVGLKQSYFVYAQGQIALYSVRHPVKRKPLEVLKQADFRRLAIANPKTAPYGERAYAYLQSEGLLKSLKSKLVYGESIANAFQYVATGNAEIGFLALSQIVDPQSPLFNKGEYWVVPQQAYKPIKQGAVLLTKGQNNEAAKAFLEFMKFPEAQEIMQNYGYAKPHNGY